MLTPQEKIDKMYEILIKQESHAKRKFYFSWWWKLLVWLFVVFFILYPHIVMQKFIQFSYPIIEKTVITILSEQKQSFTEWAKNGLNALSPSHKN